MAENESFTSQPPPELDSRWASLRTLFFVLGVLYLFLIALSVSANSLTCFVIFKSRRLQSTTNYFIVALASLGLCVDGVAILLAGRVFSPEWPFPDTICRFIGFALHACIAADVIILGAISFDRFYTIVYPLSFKTTVKSSKRLSVAAWFVGILCASPALYVYELVDGQRCEPTSGLSTARMVYAAMLGVLFFLIPLMVVIANYARTIRFVWTFEFTLHGSRMLRRTVHHVPRSKIKTIRILLAVTILDFCLLVAIYALFLVRVAGVHLVDLVSLIGGITFLLGTLKPLLYTILNSNFRRGCREVLCWSKLRCYREELYTVTRMSALARKNYVTALEPDQENKVYEYVTGASKVSPINATFDRSVLLEKDRWPITHPVKLGVTAQPATRRS